MQKAERLMAITLLLQARGKLTAERLADLLGVSVRTIYRDMNSLSLAHVPVSMDYGPGGGYFLPSELYVDPLTFTGEEAIALALGGAVAGGSHLFGDGDRLRQALIKLEAVLPEEYREDVRAARERILVDVSAWFRSPSMPPWFEPVRTAVWQRRQVEMCYQRAEADRAEWRVVEPLGLVWKAGLWYLAAYCHLRKDFRVFHVSRIQDLNLTEEPVSAYPDFDLQTFWASFLRRFEATITPVVLTLSVRPEAISRLNEEHRVVQIEPDGAAVVRIRADSMDAAVSRVLSLGPGVIVLQPIEVRDAVVDAARSIVGAHDEERGRLPA
jgi:predicted DNA-binding transcriptional regulator YafY